MFTTVSRALKDPLLRIAAGFTCSDVGQRAWLLLHYGTLYARAQVVDFVRLVSSVENKSKATKYGKIGKMWIDVQSFGADDSVDVCVVKVSQSRFESWCR